MITVSMARELINNSVNDFANGLDEITISTIAKAVTNEIQLRDFLLGLPNTNGLDKCVDFLSYLSSSLVAEVSYPIDTVNAIYQIEKGNTSLATVLLDKVAMVEPNYSLMQLARRALNAGWPGSQFTVMREQLHEKVLAHLDDIADSEIEEVEA
jgi:hypothetical protein